MESNLNPNAEPEPAPDELASAIEVEEPESNLRRLPPDDMRCTGTVSATGERCRNWRKLPFEVCRFHGARALLGPANKLFRHGRYSKMLPERLRANFVAALKDPELENLRRQVALTETRELDLLGRLNGVLTSESINKIGKIATKMRLALADADGTAIKKSLKDLEEALNEAQNDDRTWQEIHLNMEMRRRLVETERKRSEFLQVNVTPDMMATFVAQVVMVVSREVQDRNVVSRISDGIRAAAFGKRYLLEENLEDEFEEITNVVPDILGTIEEETIDAEFAEETGT